MNRPHVTLKLATSLDGRIATASGESRWITGEEARAEVQCMRAAVDAVMIGAETARRDNPSLLARTEPSPPRQPMRVVLTTAFDIPNEGRLFDALDASPLLVFGVAGSVARLNAAGAQTAIVAAAGASADVSRALAALTQAWRIGSVLVEGGGRLAASLIAEGLVDRIEWFRAPIVLGAEGQPAVGALAFAKLDDAPTWRRVAVRELGPDLWESYERVS